VQLSAQDSINTVARKNAAWSVAKRFTVAAGDLVSMFAQKLGIKIFAAKGPVEIQAQGGPMSFIADKDVNLASVNGKVNLAAAKEIILECGGAFIRIKDGSITLGGPFDVFLKTITVQKKVKASMKISLPPLPKSIQHLFDRPVWVVDDRGNSIPDRPFRVHLKSGQTLDGKTDQDGVAHLAISDEADVLRVEILKKLSGKNI
jgi:type VI secretion system secreted protein VgrG